VILSALKSETSKAKAFDSAQKPSVSDISKMCMTQFEIILEDKPGELARLTSAISCINIRSLTNDVAHNGKSIVRFMTIDEASTRNVLVSKGFRFSENTILLVGLMDRPGELAKLTRKLADEQINIDAIQLIDRSLFALQVEPDDLEHVRSVLGDTIIEA